ncbi:MAG TPA: hypothetical protein VL263_08390 [Vicinamibacterales bacterium]|jgi:hypothetical protein|nr:hypothetical protein [Vicinamibacterales bacterium]
MIERLRKTVASLSLVAGALAAGCGGSGYVEIPIQTPIAPKLDISPFQRVYVAGFLAGANEDIDANMEMVRLLRSQLRNKNILRVVDADAVPLVERAKGEESSNPATPPPAPPEGGAAATEEGQLPAVQNERDLDRYAKVFDDKEFWKQVGEEHDQALIVTGSVVFLPQAREGFVQREQETYDSFGRRVVEPIRTYQQRKGYILRPTFVFIDGRTGEQLYSESFREEVLYNSNQQTPALSSYFELMDRLLPTFLNTLSAQKIKGNRVLLK